MNDRPAPDLEQVARRTYRYWYEDGIAEMVTGLFFAFIGLFFWISSLLTGSWIVLEVLGLPVVVIGGTLFMRRLIGLLKERFVYPRTGYVAYRRRRHRSRWLIGFITAAVMITLGTLTRGMAIRLNLAVLIAAILVAAAFFAQSLRYGVLRLGLLAAVSVGIGLYAAAIKAASETAFAFYFGAMGGCLVLAGLATLVLYFRRTRQVIGVEEE